MLAPSLGIPKSQKTILLKCRVDRTKLEKIRWFEDDKPRHSIGSLINLTENYNGYYKCTAHNKAGKVESKPYYIEIHTTGHKPRQSTEIFCEPILESTNQLGERSLLCRYKYNGSRLYRRSTSEGESQSSFPILKRRKLKIAEDNPASIHCDELNPNRKANQVSVRWKKDNKLIREVMLNAPNIDISSGNVLENPLKSDGRITIDSKNATITISPTIPSDSGVYEVSLREYYD